MQLIGMLDSPYVRRTAIALRLMGLPFEHRSLSVFSTFEQFRAINPVVKAPSLVCDDGTVLMDSTLILDYAAEKVYLDRIDSLYALYGATTDPARRKAGADFDRVFGERGADQGKRARMHEAAI